MKVREVPVKRTVTQYYLPTSKSRAERKRGIIKEVMMQVPELSETEFPVAFIVHLHFAPDIEIRTYDDCLYKRNQTLDELARRWSSEDTWVFRDRKYTHKDTFVDGVSVITRDNEDTVVQSMNGDIKKNLILLDNECWVKTGEPRYAIMTFGMGNNHGGTSLSIEYSSYRSGYGNSFNALDRERAIREAKEVALGRGDTNYIEMIESADSIEVLMPEMVRYDPLMVGNVTENLCNELLRTKSLSVDAVIRDVLDGHGPEGLGAEILKCWYDASSFSSEREAVDKLFELLTGVTMKDFIERSYREAYNRDI